MAVVTFDEVFEQEYARLVRVAWLIMGDEGRAREIVQESFARALVRWDRVGGYDSPSAWLLTVTVPDRSHPQTVALPSRSVPANGQFPEARLGGVLVRDGDCLFLESVVTGGRSAIIWFGEATMTVTEDALLGVTVDGIPLDPIEGNLSFGGGSYPRSRVDDGTFTVADLQSGCLTDEVAFLYPLANESTIESSTHVVDLPTIPVQEANPTALFTGQLAGEGDCLYLDTGRERYMVLWQGEAQMTITGDQLVDVRVRGRSLALNAELQLGGGEVPAATLEDDSLEVANVRDACVTPKVFWAA